MSERGKARYKILASGSNTNIKSTPGTLYHIFSSNPSGSTIRVEDGDIGTTPDFNTSDTDTIVNFTAQSIDFWPGVGFESLNVAATSNARVTVIYE